MGTKPGLLSPLAIGSLLTSALFAGATVFTLFLRGPPKKFIPLSQVQWGIIGCGDVTEKKSGPALSLIPGSKLVMVMRRNKLKAEDYAKRHNVPRWTTDASELINDPQVNAIYIATPPRNHVQYALMAAAAGKPVYVEKPMGLTYEEGLKAVNAFERAGLPLFVAYYRRALPNFLQVKKFLDSGAIGEIRTVNIINHRPANPNDYVWAQKGTSPNKDSSSSTQHTKGIPGDSLEDPSLKWRPDPAVGGKGGYFRDLGSHQLDLLQYWLGPMVAVSGSATNQQGLYPAADSVVAQFQFESGVVGTGSWCFVVGKSADTEYGEVIGTKGSVKFHFFSSTKVVLKNETGTHEFDLPNPEHVQQPLLQTVVDSLRGEGECPSTGATALKTSFLLDVIVTGSKWP